MGGRRLLWLLVAVGLVASPLAAAASLAAHASGIPPPDAVELGLMLLAMCAAFLAAAYVTGRVMPASWSGCREEAVTWVAAVGWMLLQWLLSGLLYPLA
jgi:hypothetical protein